jgi:hypothetical protein
MVLDTVEVTTYTPHLAKKSLPARVWNILSTLGYPEARQTGELALGLAAIGQECRETIKPVARVPTYSAEGNDGNVAALRGPAYKAFRAEMKKSGFSVYRGIYKVPVNEQFFCAPVALPIVMVSPHTLLPRQRQELKRSAVGISKSHSPVEL